jgi:hypothetical protein
MRLCDTARNGGVLMADNTVHGGILYDTYELRSDQYTASLLTFCKCVILADNAIRSAISAIVIELKNNGGCATATTAP